MILPGLDEGGDFPKISRNFGAAEPDAVLPEDALEEDPLLLPLKEELPPLPLEDEPALLPLEEELLLPLEEEPLLELWVLPLEDPWLLDPLFDNEVELSVDWDWVLEEEPALLLEDKKEEPLSDLEASAAFSRSWYCFSFVTIKAMFLPSSRSVCLKATFSCLRRSCNSLMLDSRSLIPCFWT